MNRREILRLILVAPIDAALGTLKPKFIPDPMSSHFTYTHYGLGFKVSRQMIENDPYRTTHQQSADMMRLIQEEQMAQIRNSSLSGPVVDLNHIGEIGFW